MQTLKINKILFTPGRSW